ncbi:MAG: GNAT family N-acetyltransferase [Caldilineaceae bacterium]
MDVPTLESTRVLVRKLTDDDLHAIHAVLCAAFDEPELAHDPAALVERARWLQWTVLAYEQLAKLHQPPYGERAIVLKATGELIGAVGYVPCLNQFGRAPTWQGRIPLAANVPEFGMFWAIAPAQQGHGYATEAARLLVDYAFNELHLTRIVATTEYDNDASMSVMRKLGMRIEKNQHDEPFWFQVVGVMENPTQ